MELPQGFVRRMQALCGDEWDAFLDAWDKPLRRGLRVNTLKLSAEQLVQSGRLPLTASPFSPEAFYLDCDNFRAGADPLHHAGILYMQEPSAASAVTVLAPQKGERILDLCAAPGGKSTQIAAAIGPTGLLWSNEYVRARASILMQNLERCGVGFSVVSSADTGELCRRLADCFDAVLVDAPCSGEGMFRKEPDALRMWSEDNIRLCAARQQEILNNAAEAVRPGGRLVYSTCTFAPEEDEGAVAAFLRDHPDFSLCDSGVAFGRPGFDADRVAAVIPGFSCNADLTKCRRILPQDGGEGHFVARFVKAGNALPAVFPQRRGKQPLRPDPWAKEAEALWNDCFTDRPEGRFAAFGDTVRLLPADLPTDTGGLGILAAGVAAARICGKRLEPEHAAFVAHHAAECRRAVEFDPGDPRLLAYLHGEEITTEGDGGWTGVAVLGAVTGFGKAVPPRLKNHYPKGLRLL